MFDWLKRFFGEGKVRIKFTNADTGENLIVRVPYIGTWDEDECLVQLRDALLVEHGIRAINMRVVGHISL